MNTPWLAGFPFNSPAAPKIYPSLAPVLVPSFLTSAPTLTNLQFNCNLTSSSTGSSSAASSPFSFQASVQKQESTPKSPKAEKSTNENLFPNKPLGELSAKSQLFLIEKLFPQLAAVAFQTSSSSSDPETIKTPQKSPTFSIQKPISTSPINKLFPLLPALPQCAPSSVEYVNGGYGLKNPLLHSNSTFDSTNSCPAPASKSGLLSCRICGKVRPKVFESYLLFLGIPPAKIVESTCQMSL